MFYDLFFDLCRKKGVSPSKACLEMGLSRSLAAKWKNTKQSPSAEVLPKIAAYFDVTVDYLLGNEKKPAAESDGLTAKDRRDIARELEKMMADLEDQKMLMFDGDPASPEAVESIRNALAMGLEYAKKVNKEKYTPKKYRKGKNQEG